MTVEVNEDVVDATVRARIPGATARVSREEDGRALEVAFRGPALEASFRLPDWMLARADDPLAVFAVHANRLIDAMQADAIEAYGLKGYMDGEVGAAVERARGQEGAHLMSVLVEMKEAEGDRNTLDAIITRETDRWAKR